MKLGIDFGTTTCTVGRLQLGGERFVMDPEPSIAAWSNGTLTFGERARDLLRSSRTDVYPIRDLKMLLGSDRPIPIGQGVLNPEHVASELFRYLVARIGASSVTGAVIGTPVSVPVGQRQATRRAAVAAGIGDVSFVYEPTAALIGARRFTTVDARGLTLVVDWGGGTLDIAVVRTDGSRYEEVTVGGDLRVLGGSKIDEEITSSLLERDHDLRSRIAAVPEGVQRLKDEIEQMKLEILTSLDGPAGEPEEISPLWLPRTVIRLERSLVYEVLNDFAERAARVITSKLQAAGISAQEITDVLFAGGVCQAAEIQARVMRDFPNARQMSNVAGSSVLLQPQALTGAGCAEITSREMIPELSRALGIRQSDGSICILLPAGFPIKVNTYRSADFLVTNPDADEAVLDVGLLTCEHGSISMTAGADGWESLQQIFVPAGAQTTWTQRTPEPECLQVRVGIDRDLAVTISASAELARRTVTRTQSGIPLILRFGS